MPENKTKPTEVSVDDYIASRANEQQRADCARLLSMFRKITRQQPQMWGPSIVGYGKYRYEYESGRTGEAPMTGFAIRGREIVIYIVASGEKQKSLLSKVGKHRIGKSCFYFKQLADLDHAVLEELVTASIADMKQRYTIVA